MKKNIVLFFLAILLVGAIISAQYEIIKNSEGKITGIKEGETQYPVPQGFDVEIDENNNLIFTNIEGTIEDFKFKDISIQTSKDSRVIYSEINGQFQLNLEGQGDLVIGETSLNNIQDAIIKFDENNQINFAEFTSTKKEKYTFDYNDKEYLFNTEKNSKVLFDPAKNIIQGENTKLTFDNKDINGQSFSLAFNKDGKINQLRITNGLYYDKLNDLKYSDEEFTIYFDGRDISKEKNAISIFSERGKVQTIGKIKIESSDIAYEGLVDSAFFERWLQGRDELVSINANEDKSYEQGGIAKLTKKFKTGNLLAEEGFAEKEQGIETIISREDGKMRINVNKNSITQIKEDITGTKFALIDKNLWMELGDKQGYFGVNTNFGMIYENPEGNNVEILSFQKTQQYLGNDINTIKGIITSQVEKNFGESLDLHALELQKIYDLEEKQIIQGENQLKESIQNFEETKTFIEKTYTDSLQKDALLTSFMLNNFEGIKPDWNSKNWETQLKNQREFSQKALSEINKKIQSNEITQDFLINNKGDLNSLSLNLLKKASENSNLAVQYKESFEKILENKIIYEDLAGKYISNYKKDEASLINSYKGLLSLEETQLLMQQGELKLERKSSTFSTRKFNLAEALAVEYAKQEKSLEVFGLLDKLDNDLSSYIAETSQKIDFNDPAYQDQLNALKNLKERINMDRSALANTELNKIQLDLYTQEGEIQKVFAARKGYTEKVSEAEAGLETLGAVVLSGGFGKDIVNLAGGFDDVKESASVLKQENQVYSKGVYGIQSLNQMNVPGQIIEDWINDKPVITNNFIDELLIKSGRATEPISESKEFAGKEVDKQGKLTGRKIIISTEGKRYAIDPTQEKLVFDFLKEVKKDAKQTYSSSLYGQDVQQLIGTRDIEYDETNYEALEKRKLGEFQAEVFKNRINELQFSEPEKVLNYIDEVISPAAIAITAVTGGMGANIFSSATGLTGVAYGFGENVLIDAATGAILISSGLSPEEHPYLATGISMGTGITSVGISKALKSASSVAFDDLSKAIVKNSNLKEIEISDALKSLSSDQLRDINLVTKQLRDAGLSVEPSLLQKSFADFELKNSARAKFEDAKLKIEKANGQNFAKQTESSCTDCVERSFEIEDNLEQIVRKQSIISDFNEAKIAKEIYDTNPENNLKPILVDEKDIVLIEGQEIKEEQIKAFKGIYLEHPEGEPLTDYLKTHKELSENQKEDLVHSLAKLHDRFVHNNIGPDNIIVTPEGKLAFINIDYKENARLYDIKSSIGVQEAQAEFYKDKYNDLINLQKIIKEELSFQHYSEFPIGSNVYFFDGKEITLGKVYTYKGGFEKFKGPGSYPEGYLNKGSGEYIDQDMIVLKVPTDINSLKPDKYKLHRVEYISLKNLNSPETQWILKKDFSNREKKFVKDAYDKFPESWISPYGPEKFIIDKKNDESIKELINVVKERKNLYNLDDERLATLILANIRDKIPEYDLYLSQGGGHGQSPVPASFCFKEKKAVCRNFASIYKAVADEVDLSTALASGPTFSETGKKTGGYHAWNMVKTKDKVLMVDPTSFEIYNLKGKSSEEIKKLTRREIEELNNYYYEFKFFIILLKFI